MKTKRQLSSKNKNKTIKTIKIIKSKNVKNVKSLKKSSKKSSSAPKIAAKKAIDRLKKGLSIRSTSTSNKKPSFDFDSVNNSDPTIPSSFDLFKSITQDSNSALPTSQNASSQDVQMPAPPVPPTAAPEKKSGFFAKLFKSKTVNQNSQSKQESTEELIDDLDKLEQSILTVNSKSELFQDSILAPPLKEIKVVEKTSKNNLKSNSSNKKSFSKNLANLNKVNATNAEVKMPQPLVSQDNPQITLTQNINSMPKPPTPKQSFFAKLFSKKVGNSSTDAKFTKLSQIDEPADDLEKLEQELIAKNNVIKSAEKAKTKESFNSNLKSKGSKSKKVVVPTELPLEIITLPLDDNSKVVPKSKEMPSIPKETQKAQNKSVSLFDLFKKESKVQVAQKTTEQKITVSNDYNSAIAAMGLHERSIYNLEKKKKELQDQIAEHEKHIKILETKKRDKLEQINARHEDLLRKESDLSRKFKELDLKKQEHEKIHTSLKNKEEDHLKLAQRIKAYEKQISNLEVEINNLYILKDRLQKENKSFKFDLNEKERMLYQKEKSLNEKEQQLKQTENDLQKSKKVHLEMHELLTKRKVEFEAKSQLIANFEKKQNLLLVEIEKSKIQKEKLNLEILDLDKSINDKINLKKQVETESKPLLEMSNKLKEQANKAKVESVKAQKELNSLQKELSTKKKQLEVLEKKISTKSPKPKIDSETKNILLVLDDLLGKLPENEVEAFSKSADFDKYEKVMSKFGIK